MLTPKMSTLRVRFAPSPTGHLHIGGARTALFNWLLARKENGTFILRIEDTDRERSTSEYIDSIMEGMQWLGLDWDEGPFHQVDRFDIYNEHIDKLLTEGKAYKCFCSKEELDAHRQAMQKQGLKPKYDGRCRQADQSQDKTHCIRFLSPDVGQTTIHDHVRGEVIFENKELDDLIIRRSDGTPTYNLCVVVDDVTMKITTLIRGDDHLNNSPRQVQLYKAFDYPVPLFCHVPMILGTDKKRLSKRHGATSVLAYRDQGYLPEALANYLARLGWSHGDEEFFTMQDLSEKFSLDHLGKSAGVFNPEKLLWLNAQHMKQKSASELLTMSAPFFKEAGIEVEESEYAVKALSSIREKAKLLPELVTASSFYFEEPTRDPKAAEKFLDQESKVRLLDITERIAKLECCDEEHFKKMLESYLVEKDLKLKLIAQPLRVALTGNTVSPGIYALMSILGKDRVLQRLKLI
jgi:glutamyl-tRNA synthetase